MRKIWNSKACSRNKDSRILQAYRMEDALASWGRRGLAIKIHTSQNHQCCPQSTMMSFVMVLSFLDPKYLMLSMMLIQVFTFPESTCLPSEHSDLVMRMKTCESFVFGSAFAMNKILVLICSWVNSPSSNVSLQKDLPSVPLWQVKSPPDTSVLE